MTPPPDLLEAVRRALQAAKQGPWRIERDEEDDSYLVREEWGLERVIDIHLNAPTRTAREAAAMCLALNLLTVSDEAPEWLQILCDRLEAAEKERDDLRREEQDEIDGLWSKIRGLTEERDGLRRALKSAQTKMSNAYRVACQRDRSPILAHIDATEALSKHVRAALSPPPPETP